ncbi:unnamed protein product [marine sediment metagenome]|uniref:Uncharacterized protein n=1 Tax=marine sediment metagenome TaxID=412755 RepID=X1U183_9ZZZZ
MENHVTHETYLDDVEQEEGYIPEDCINRIVDELSSEVKTRTNLG